MSTIVLNIWVAQPYHLSLVVPTSLSVLELVGKIEAAFLETFGVILQVQALQDRNYNDLPLTDLKLGLLLKNNDKVYVVLQSPTLRTVGRITTLPTPRVVTPSSPASPLSPLSPSSPLSPATNGPPLGLDNGLQTYFRLRSSIDNSPSSVSEADLIFQRFATINDVLRKKRCLRETDRDFDSIKPDFSSLPTPRKELLVKLGRSMTVDLAKLIDNSNRGHAFSPISKSSLLTKRRRDEPETSPRKDQKSEL